MRSSQFLFQLGCSTVVFALAYGCSEAGTPISGTDPNTGTTGGNGGQYGTGSGGSGGLLGSGGVGFVPDSSAGTGGMLNFAGSGGTGDAGTVDEVIVDCITDQQCDDGNACTSDACTGAGLCDNVPIDGNCDDGSSCTTSDTCDAGICVGTDTCTDGKSCIAGFCSNCRTDSDCDDRNPCTSDVCSAGTCSSTDLDAGECTDGVACTSGDHCVGGTCISGVGDNNVCNDNNVCTADACTSTEGCKNTGNTASCDDGVACTTDTCSSKVCVGVPTEGSCSDGNPCTADICDTVFGCSNPADDTGSCSDNPTCTMDNACLAGVCKGTDTCSGGKFCPPTGGCTDCTSDTDCSDDDPCTDDVCGGSGCEYTLNTANCDDGVACTNNDTCNAGICGGSPDNGYCDDTENCTTNTCDPAQGCVVTNNSNDCDDGYSCTHEDRCVGGSCGSGTPTPADCDDQNICTTNSCDTTNGDFLTGCYTVNNSNDCTDDVTCTDDVCYEGGCSSVANCDPGEQCVTETQMSTIVTVRMHLTSESEFKAVETSGLFDPEDAAVSDFDPATFEFSNESSSLDAEFDCGWLCGNRKDNMDAIASYGGDLVVSFDRSGSLPDQDDVLEHELWLYNGATWSLWLDISGGIDCRGIGCDVSLDAAHIMANGDVYFSLGGRGTIITGDVDFDEGDIIRHSGGVYTRVAVQSSYDDRDIDGISVNPITQRFVVSFTNDGSNGSAFEQEDIVQLAFGPGDIAIPGTTMFMDGSAHMVDDGGNINGVHIE